MNGRTGPELVKRFEAMVIDQDSLIQTLAVGNAIGYGVAMSSRNAGRPAIAIGQICLAIVPPIVAWVSFMARIREAQGMAGLPQTANFWGSVLRALLISFNVKWHQDQFNEISLRPPQY